MTATKLAVAELILLRRRASLTRGSAASKLSALAAERVFSLRRDDRAAMTRATVALFIKEYAAYDLRGSPARLEASSLRAHELLAELAGYRKFSAEQRALLYSGASRLYKLLEKLGSLGATVAVATAGPANVEESACCYFLASAATGGGYLSSGLLKNFRSGVGPSISHLDRVRPDVVLLSDSGLSSHAAAIVRAGGYFLVGLSDRDASQSSYDVTFRIGSLSAETRQLFLGLVFAALLSGMSLRAEARVVAASSLLASRNLAL